jgi:O-methyltransferase involved in polyketide biosynthesis
VTIDLEKDSLIERLLTAGFDNKKQTVFLFEGVIYFLTDKILNKINNLDFFKTKSDISIFMDFWDDKMVKNRSRSSRQFYSFPFGKNNNEIIASFKEMGFQNVQIESILKYFHLVLQKFFTKYPVAGNY